MGTEDGGHVAQSQQDVKSPNIFHPQQHQMQPQAPSYPPVAQIPQMQPSPQLQPPGYPGLVPTPRKRQRAGESSLQGLSPASSSSTTMLREPPTHSQGSLPILGPGPGNLALGPPNIYAAPRHEYATSFPPLAINEYPSTNHGLHTEHQQHHHHRLPEVLHVGHSSTAASLGDRTDLDANDLLYTDAAFEHKCMVGVEGFPPPAPTPTLPKSKFTPEDDELLKLLKDEKKLSWKQIADFFPRRTSGTLQVRYCTKLRKKKESWDPDSDQKLKDAIASYERERWKTIALRVGSGFTKEDCEARAVQLEVEARATQQASHAHAATQRQDSPAEMEGSEGGDGGERRDVDGVESGMHQQQHQQQQHPSRIHAEIHRMPQEQRTQGYEGQWHTPSHTQGRGQMHGHGYSQTQADASTRDAPGGPNEW